MKKLFIAFLLLSSGVALDIHPGWPAETAEKRERDRIMQQIAKIKEQYPMGSGARYREIAGLLKDIGTPVSWQIYQEMKASGELPARF